MVDAQFLLTMRKSDHSAMYIADCNSEEDPDDALVGREKSIVAMNELVRNVFYHESNKDFAYLKETFLNTESIQIRSNAKR